MVKSSWSSVSPTSSEILRLKVAAADGDVARAGPADGDEGEVVGRDIDLVAVIPVDELIPDAIEADHERVVAGIAGNQVAAVVVGVDDVIAVTAEDLVRSGTAV